jgi:hypothetical protein
MLGFLWRWLDRNKTRRVARWLRWVRAANDDKHIIFRRLASCPCVDSASAEWEWGIFADWRLVLWDGHRVYGSTRRDPRYGPNVHGRRTRDYTCRQLRRTAHQVARYWDGRARDYDGLR